MNKLDIKYEMAQFDRKNRNFLNELTDEERKKFSTFLMIRWGSCVQAEPILQEFYLRATNERLNKHFFALHKHPQLQWLCATTVSPGMGIHRHNWLSTKKKEPAGIKKQLSELFPHLRDDELELMAKINTKKDVDAYLKELGQEAKK